MALPSLPLRIPAFLGDSQSSSPFLLADAYSSGGSVNIYIDKLGQIRTVGGWLRQNAAAYTTDTGASAAMIRALYNYRRVAAGATTRQLLFVLDDQVNEWELWFSTDLGVTGTLIADLGAGSVGAIPDFGLFGDELYVVNGVITARLWNGTALANVGATQLAAPTLADAGAGSLNGSGYKYRVVPIQANKARKAGSVSSASLQVRNRRITVTWAADADGTVIGYEVWRTSGSGLDFYLVGYVDGRLTVTYVGDTLPDSDLITREAMSVVASHGDAPPTGAYFAVPHKGRMWWLRTDTYPRRGWISDPGDADSVYVDRNYIDCTDAASLGDICTGGTGEYEGVFVFWCENTVWVISGTGRIIGEEIDWRKRRTNAKTGALTHRAVVRVPAGAVYINQEGQRIVTEQNTLAFLTPQKDIRLFDGGNDTIISYPKLDTLALLNKAHGRKAYAYDDVDHSMFVWVYPSGAATEPNYAVAWNYRYGTWHEWDGANWGHVTQGESSAGAFSMVAGEARVATGAFLYKLWTGDTRDGASITGTWMSKPIYPAILEGGPPDIQHEKRLEALFMLFAKDASPTALTIGILPHDAADGDTPEISRTAISATSRVLVPARQPPTGENPGKYFSGPGFRLKATSTATSGPWVLEAIEGSYQVLPGTTR